MADWGKSVRPVPGCSNVAESETRGGRGMASCPQCRGSKVVVKTGSGTG